MKKISKILITLLLVIVALFGIAGCNADTQNSSGEERGTGTQNGSEEEISDSLPKSRTFIVTDRENFEKISVDNFTGFEVNFDNEMIIVHTFVTEYVLPAKIADIKLSDKTITINYHIGLIRNAGSARAPFQRWSIVKLDKLDITSSDNIVSKVYTDEDTATGENLPYNAQFFDNCGSWINEHFQTNNRLKGAIYYYDEI